MKTYVTLEKLISDKVTWYKKIEFGEIVDNYLKNFCESFNFDVNGFSNDSPANQTISNKLFCRYIIPRFKTLNCTYYEGDLDDIELNALYIDFLRRFLFVLNTTYDKYSTVINAFEAQRTALLDDIKIVSQTKFNNTPQNTQGTYDWGDDNHLTNISKNEVSNPVTTKIARLDEVNRLLDGYYLNWSNEFARVFMYD